MLMRRCLVVAALLMGLTPPLTGESRADTAWALRMARDFVQAQRDTRGKDVKIALVGDGVASGVRPLRGAVKKEKDFVRTPRAKRNIGTLMASLIVGGATEDGLLKLRGLLPSATILPVRVYAAPDEPGGKEWWKTVNWGNSIGDGVRYAADQGADVIAVEPFAFGGGGYRNGEGVDGTRSAIAYARSKNAVVVAPSGDQRPNDPSYPAAAPGVIGVGGVTEQGRRAKKWTSSSSAVFVAAPSFEMPATGYDNRLWTFKGDPVALAFATAAVAMLKSKYRRLTPAQIGEALSASARRPAGKRRYDTELGFGYVNPAGALDNAHRIANRPGLAMTATPSVPDTAGLGGDRPGPIKAAPYDPVRKC
ncbi:S8 family serine peptidase [Actinomadura rubrisoli]|uniref:Peptidase S8/S53 domain-containing protein n=1 Tax=Actinomadura rubrisoli TaxID=2530368 RepID=A0A4R5A2K9_9ACTN|nr:S8 family serine peptidase [Actinomadura rubrisoli]TDD65056.1 hypothetical protein E1298_41780 [Actinomadura rubrisoli]